jgi:hypothetical protein
LAPGILVAGGSNYDFENHFAFGPGVLLFFSMDDAFCMVY